MNTSQFRSFPLPAIDDRELSNAEFDVLVAKCRFHNDSGKKYWEKPATPEMLAEYTSLSVRRIRELLPSLVDLDYLTFERHGRNIVNIRWSEAKDIQRSVRRHRSAVFVRLPRLVLEDTSLKPHERRAYLTIVRHAHLRGGGPFYLSAQNLADLLGLKTRQGANKILKSMRERKLIAYLPGRDGDSCSRMVLPPLEDAYPGTETETPEPAKPKKPTVNELLDRFEARYQEALGSEYSSGWSRAGANNRKILAEHIRRWISKDKTNPLVIANMIDMFFESDSRFMRGGREAVWQQFVNAKSALERYAYNRYYSTLDDLGWDEPWEDNDEDLGWGKYESWSTVQKRQQRQKSESV